MQNRLIFLIILFMTLIFTSCSKTTVVLLDNGKTQNAVIVSTDKGSTQLNKVGNFVELKEKTELPSAVQTMSKEEIESRFSNLFAITPKKSLSYILIFKSGAMELNKVSETVLNNALKSIKKRSPCMVDVIGHTDTVGSNEGNLKISLKRAKYIKSIIKNSGTKIISLKAKGYGEEDLLVKTADNIAEAKNRRVEIFIK